MTRTTIPPSGFRQALVVDDSLAMRAVLRKDLEQLGFAVVEAADGVEALEKLEHMRMPDVVLVDWNMPRMNGLGLVRKLRENPAYERVAILMVTSETSTHNVLEALAAGADEYLMKPFSVELLKDKLVLLEEQEGLP